MKKLITILTLILLTTSFAISQDKYVEWAKEMSKTMIAKGFEDTHGLIVKQANEEWKGDYNMIAYEIKRQCKALYEFIHMKTPIGMPENTFHTVQLNAMMGWTEYDSNDKMIKADWVMILYEMKNQIEAYLEIF